MTQMQDIKKKSEAEITEMVQSARETVRAERFKDKFGRKASIIRNAKTEVARGLTELSARRNNGDTK